MGAARPQKRRKLVSVSSALLPNTQSGQSLKQHPVITTRPICASCHRALNTAQSSLIICARCSSPICAICSRTCTSTLPSIPPTPLLTRSSTPLPMSPSQSPRRLALTLQSTNTTLYDLQLSIANGIAHTGKRRKPADEGDSRDDEGLEGRLSEFDLVPGCGRIMCRNCCFEDVQSDSTTCYDCYSR